MPIKSIFIFTVFAMWALHGLAQADNALPPGPGRIFGTVVNESGMPMSGVEIQVVYPDGKARSADIFKSHPNGIFTCYVFRYDQPNVVLVFRVNGKICLRKPISGVFEGSNHGRDADKYVCAIKKRKGFFQRRKP
jgi:hypothetical protein